MAFFGVGEENFIVGGGEGKLPFGLSHASGERKYREGGGNVLRMKARRFPERNNSRHCANRFSKSHPFLAKSPRFFFFPSFNNQPDYESPALFSRRQLSRQDFQRFENHL